MRERGLLVEYGSGTEPDREDPFPDLQLTPQFGDVGGLLLEKPDGLSLRTGYKKTIYQNCVKVLFRKGLRDRVPSVWDSRLRGDEAAPRWRVLYKPPLGKRTADLQWRILHGAIALNSFISVLNPAVLNHCPFYHLPETVFRF